jgi:hypothetical protein
MLACVHVVARRASAWLGSVFEPTAINDASRSGCEEGRLLVLRAHLVLHRSRQVLLCTIEYVKYSQSVCVSSTLLYVCSSWPPSEHDPCRPNLRSPGMGACLSSGSGCRNTHMIDTVTYFIFRFLFFLFAWGAISLLTASFLILMLFSFLGHISP